MGPYFKQGNPGDGCCGTSPPPPPPGVTIPGCTCTSTPSTLSMSSSGPCVATDFPACTIVYGPTPAQFSSLGLGSSCYLSTTTFVDPYTGRSFYFTLTCSTAFYRLSRVYLATSYGPAYHDGAIYSWTIGAAGNTCSPFALAAGTIYSGGNPKCIVSISS